MPVDTDGDGDIDIAYAGDLRGNLWKFNLLDLSNPSVGKLFSAVDSSNNQQPITSAPVAVPHPQGGFMVGFGTGKYLEHADLSNTAEQTLYGIWDNQPGGSVSTVTGGRTDLQEQTVLTVVNVAGVDYRLTSDNSIDYTDSINPPRGWYMDLPSPGERVSSGLK